MRWVVYSVLLGILCLCGCSHSKSSTRRAARNIDPLYSTLIHQSIVDSTQQLNTGHLPPADVPDSLDVEEASARALLWLQSHQRADGTWLAYRPVRTTALAGLALFGVKPHATNQQAVLRAAQWLVEQQQADGSWAVKRLREQPIDQALAVWFLATVLLQQDDPALATAVESGARYILSKQQQGGGWAYAYGQTAYRNTLVSICQLLALRAVSNAGMLLPDIEHCYDLSMRDLLYVQDTESGAFGDEFRGVDRWSATGEAVLGLQLIGLRRIPETMHGIEALEGMVNGWLGAADWPLLESLLNHYAFQLQGGELWARWSVGVLDELLEWQQLDGSWNPPGSEFILGPAYATALCTLMLQGSENILHMADATSEWMPPLWKVQTDTATQYILLTVPLASYDLYLLPASIMNVCAKADRIISLVDENELYPLLINEAVYSNSDNRCHYDPALLRRVATRLQVPKLGATQLNDVKPWALISGLMFVAAEQKGLEYDVLQRKLSFAAHHADSGTLLKAQELIDILNTVECDLQLQILHTLVDLLKTKPGYARDVANAWGRGDVMQMQQLLSPLLSTNESVVIDSLPAISKLRSLIAERIYAAENDRQQTIYLLDPVFVTGTNNVLDRLQNKGMIVERQ